ncbi:MAG TPA: MFS transporter [Candidatus Micrarchaeia archaeon]|nr:MFS transporter [Candidatus Micrarchaeia archaeon]
MNQGMHTRWLPLRYPAFRALFIGGGLSWYGDFLTIPALLVIGYELGGQAGVGWMTIASTLPMVVLLPLGGWLGDRGDRRRRLIALDLVRAAMAAVVAASAIRGGLPIVLAAVALGRSATALYNPGWRRLLPAVLPASLIPDGSSLLNAVGDGAILAGAGIGALLLLVIHPQVLIAVDGLTFLASALLLAGLGPQPTTREVAGRIAAAGVWQPLLDGFRWIARDPLTRLFAWAMWCGVIGVTGLRVYFVVIAHRVLGVPTDAVGILYLCVGAGSVLGSVGSVWRARVPGWVLVAVLAVAPAGILVVGTTSAAVVAVLMLVVLAASQTAAEAWGFTRVQTRTPDHGVGRAMGAILWCFVAGQAVGAVTAAWASTHIPRSTFFLGWFGFTLVGAVVIVAPSIRSLARPVGRREAPAALE